MQGQQTSKQNQANNSLSPISLTTQMQRCLPSHQQTTSVHRKAPHHSDVGFIWDDLTFKSINMSHWQNEEKVCAFSKAEKRKTEQYFMTKTVSKVGYTSNVLSCESCRTNPQPTHWTGESWSLASLTYLCVQPFHTVTWHCHLQSSYWKTAAQLQIFKNRTNFV